MVVANPPVSAGRNDCPVSATERARRPSGTWFSPPIAGARVRQRAVELGTDDVQAHPADAVGREGSVGGTGVKIHPDFRHGNLYWLLGDSHLRGKPLPLKTRPYSSSPDVP